MALEADAASVFFRVFHHVPNRDRVFDHFDPPKRGTGEARVVADRMAANHRMHPFRMDILEHVLVAGKGGEEPAPGGQYGVLPAHFVSGRVDEHVIRRDKGAERRAKLAALAAGKIQILVGTHAVFQADVTFRDLRLAIVDEQHRFGVRQRKELAEKGLGADVLVMTATPIPRSLALAQYGDMDVSVLDEKPPGRKPIRTALLSAERMEEVVDHLRRAVAEGRQAYWVCPLVEESESLDLTAAEDRFRHLRAVLGEGVVGLVHGQMPPAEKDAAMADFIAGRSQVLVATTVIEVGVNVPNATIMVIERAETFGLAQLHQLRGRVGRGQHPGLCLLMTSVPEISQSMQRLRAVEASTDGFELARVDLEQRREGDVLGSLQSGGVSSLHFLSLLEDGDVIADARELADEVVGADLPLADHRPLADLVDAVLVPNKVKYLDKS